MAKAEHDTPPPEEQEPTTPKKKKKKKRRPRSEGVDWGFYTGFFSFLLAPFTKPKNVALILAITGGVIILGLGFSHMRQGAGTFAIPFLAAGFGIILTSLAMRFVFFPD